MFWLAWQLLGVLIVLVVIVAVLSIGWDLLRYVISPSERASMPGFGRGLFRLGVGIAGALFFYWLFWHR
jgi:hypothetical protein